MPNRKQITSYTILAHTDNEIHLSKKTTIRLPSPFSSKCVVYENSKEYRKYRNNDECYNVCIKNYSFRKHNCSNYYSVITSVRMFNLEDFETICPHDKQVNIRFNPLFVFCLFYLQNYTTYLEAKKHCADQCPNECETILYSLSKIDPRPMSNKCVGHRCYNILLTIVIASRRFALFQQKPLMRMNELVATIGGHFGIWLGFSEYKFMQFVLSVVTICGCFLWKRFSLIFKKRI